MNAGRSSGAVVNNCVLLLLILLFFHRLPYQQSSLLVPLRLFYLLAYLPACLPATARQLRHAMPCSTHARTHARHLAPLRAAGMTVACGRARLSLLCCWEWLGVWCACVVLDVEESGFLCVCGVEWRHGLAGWDNGSGVRWLRAGVTLRFVFVCLFVCDMYLRAVLHDCDSSPHAYHITSIPSSQTDHTPAMSNHKQ